MNEFKWGEPQKSPARSLPWDKLSTGRFTYRVLLVRNEFTNGKWRETKLMVLVGATRADDQHRLGQLIYIARPEQKKETRFHPTTFDALLRGAKNTDTSVQARSVELSGDAETLRSYSGLLGVDWYGVKDNLGLRMAMAAVLGDMSARYQWAIRERLLYVSGKAGVTASLQDRHNPPRDNPGAMRAQWHAAARRLYTQYEFNEKAVGSAADMVLLARSVQAYVGDLVGQLLGIDWVKQPGKANSLLREMEGFLIFNSLCNATKFMKAFRVGKHVVAETIAPMAAAFVAEQQLCTASGLVSLVRDFPEFRTQQTFGELHDYLAWDHFDSGYASLGLQAQVYSDLLQAACQSDNTKAINRAAKQFKALVRGRYAPSLAA